ncbi:MAG: type I-E CRISPR-associated protein Cse2/CasB, partial [Acidobacteria bacterium]|nr:type I-E CRISPR-associated protein Cse2/CasB [Acidobacteriota bacterium]
HWYYLIATLFGLYPKQKPGYPRRVNRNGKAWTEHWSLGAAFRPLKQKSDSMGTRFVALLNAHPDDLDDHLRHAVSLLKSNDQPLDWFRLFEDLLQWDHPDGHVQLWWARDFYRSDSGKAYVPDSDLTTKEED